MKLKPLAGWPNNPASCSSLLAGRACFLQHSDVIDSMDSRVRTFHPRALVPFFRLDSSVQNEIERLRWDKAHSIDAEGPAPVQLFVYVPSNLCRFPFHCKDVEGCGEIVSLGAVPGVSIRMSTLKLPILR